MPLLLFRWGFGGEELPSLPSSWMTSGGGLGGIGGSSGGDEVMSVASNQSTVL